VRSLGTVALAALAGLCVVLAAPAGGEFSRQRTPIPDGAELALFPTGRMLTEMSLGHPHLLADAAWLAAVQYYGKHRLSDRRYPLAPQVFDVITQADPGFRSAYLFGALVAAEDGNPVAAEALLRRGVERNPDSWELQFELGFYLYVYRGSWSEAAQRFQRAAALRGAPEYVARFAAAAWERADQPDFALLLWERIAQQTDNSEIRRIAVERVRALRGQTAAGAAPEIGGGR
jgi:tetratricopeptide (TPR) repeat protein